MTATTNLPKTIVLAHYHGKQKVEQMAVPFADTKWQLESLNAVAAKGWHWRLCETNFIDDDGVQFTEDERDEIRKAVFGS